MLASELAFQRAGELHKQLLEVGTREEFYVVYKQFRASLPVVCDCWDAYLVDGQVTCPKCGNQMCPRCAATGCSMCRMRG
jgi:hypothetical protein